MAWEPLSGEIVVVTLNHCCDRRVVPFWVIEDGTRFGRIEFKDYDVACRPLPVALGSG
jgi:hypothetical protein